MAVKRPDHLLYVLSEIIIFFETRGLAFLSYKVKNILVIAVESLEIGDTVHRYDLAVSPLIVTIIGANCL